MLARFVAMGDASDELRRWAEGSEEFTPVPGGYRFSFQRDLGPVRLVVVDSRNGRVLTPGARRMVDDEEWELVAGWARQPCDHLVVATSVPLVMPGGLHELERWNELVSEGAWGRWFAPVGEKVRRGLDLEDWASFHDSYVAMMSLLREIATPAPGAPEPPASITVVSGDVHFSFRATAGFPAAPGQPAPTARVHQIVNSPMRNVLAARERRAMRIGLSRAGNLIGRLLRRAAGARPDPARWQICEGPFFGNHICALEFSDRSANMVLSRAAGAEDGRPKLTVAAAAEL
jgi:hypothetical protein